MKNRIINVGIIGTGYGKRVILPVVKSINKLKVKYIFSRKNKKKYKKNIQNLITNDILEIKKDKSIDLLFIESPPKKHIEHLRLFSKNQNHIVCEKPLITEKTEIKHILDMPRNKNFLYAVNHQLRFDPYIIKINEIIKKNILGKIKLIIINHNTNKFDEKKKDNWWLKKKEGGGELNAIGVHLIDLIKYLNGNIINIKSNIHFSKKGKYKIDTSFLLSLKFKNMSNGIIQSSCVANKDDGLNISIFFEKGTVKLKNFEDLKVQNKYMMKKILITDKLRKKKVIGINPWRRAQAHYINHIIDIIRNPKISFKGAGFREAIDTTKLIYYAIKSFKLKKRLNIL